MCLAFDPHCCFQPQRLEAFPVSSQVGSGSTGPVTLDIELGGNLRMSINISQTKLEHVSLPEFARILLVLYNS